MLVRIYHDLGTWQQLADSPDQRHIGLPSSTMHEQREAKETWSMRRHAWGCQARRGRQAGGGGGGRVPMALKSE